MPWIVLALASAFTMAAADALLKKFFSDLNAYEMGHLYFFYSAPWMIVPLLLSPVPQVEITSWLTMVSLIPLEILALVLYMRAIQISPLSLTIPFLAFTPVWMIGVGLIVLDELPNLWGGIGILVVAAGAYLLNLDTLSFNHGAGVFEPIKAIFRERGSRLMLLVSLIYAVTATVGKKLILDFGDTYFGSMYSLVLMISTGPAFWASGKLDFRNIITRPGRGLILGLCATLSLLSHVWAMTLAPAAYMMAVKRLSLVFAVLYGRWLFKEARFGQRLAGASVMLAGLVLISVWG
ncbi:MAG: DMT family transporter [Thermodesulfobacteriota bacterium]